MAVEQVAKAVLLDLGRGVHLVRVHQLTIADLVIGGSIDGSTTTSDSLRPSAASRTASTAVGGIRISNTVKWAYDHRRRTLSAQPGERVSMALPLEVAAPVVLMERAVIVAGDLGLTLQEMRRIFKPLGKDRYDEALRSLRDGGTILEAREERPNRSGRLQTQVVLRAMTGSAGD